MTKADSCPICAVQALSMFFEMPDVPVYCNLLWPAREAALQTPRAGIALGFCENCGYIGNLAFEPARLSYGQDYENSLHFSPRFQAYAEELAARLIAQYDLHDKQIVEIGCGQGDFLALLCRLGRNRGMGFDPSYVNGRSELLMPGIAFVRDIYSERYADYRADLICCRHVLEHIPHPLDMLMQVRRAIGERHQTVVFFEVPNVLFTLRDLAIWDIIYEHCSYFSASSLAHAFVASGFKLQSLAESFDGQFLSLEATPRKNEMNSSLCERGPVEQMRGYVTAFTANFRNKVEEWQQKLERILHGAKRAVVWGAGSKGVTFLNTLERQNEIRYVVDINPRKQGKFIVGTGQRIVSPEFLRSYRPETAIVMNAIYVDEIRRHLADLGVCAEVVCV